MMTLLEWAGVAALALAGGWAWPALVRLRNRWINRREGRKRARDPRGYHESVFGPGSWDEMIERRAWMEDGCKGPPPIAARRAKQETA